MCYSNAGCVWHVIKGNNGGLELTPLQNFTLMHMSGHATNIIFMERPCLCRCCAFSKDEVQF